MRDLNDMPNSLGLSLSATKNDKLPDWPAFITSFEKLSSHPPGPSGECVAQHLPIVRLANVLIDQDRQSLTQQVNRMSDYEGNPELLEGLIGSLNDTRLMMTAYWCACEWALCRLSIVLGRNVLDDLPE